MYLHKSGILQKLCGVHAYASPLVLGGRLVQSVVITQQKNKRAHFNYCSRLNYTGLKRIVPLEKMVEVRRFDGKQASP